MFRYMELLTITRIADGATHKMAFPRGEAAQGTFERLDAKYPGVYRHEIEPIEATQYWADEDFDQAFAIMDMEAWQAKR